MFNFGSSGQAPSNPELLDWLAMEFMDSGWSMKHMHRLMVLEQYLPDAIVGSDGIR